MTGYGTFLIALGLVLLFGFWSGSRRRKPRNDKKTKGTKGTKAYPLAKSQAKLRRIK